MMTSGGSASSAEMKAFPQPLIDRRADMVVEIIVINRAWPVVSSAQHRPHHAGGPVNRYPASAFRHPFGQRHFHPRDLFQPVRAPKPVPVEPAAIDEQKAS